MTTKEKNFNIPFTGSDVFVTLKIVYSQLDAAHSHSSFAESTNNNKVYLRRMNKKNVENVKEQQQIFSAYNIVIPGQGKAPIKTDIQVELPEDCYGRVAPRSGLSWKNHIDIGAGVIDRDYRGNVGVVLFNHAKTDFEVKKGDRVAQLICEKIVYPEVCELVDTERGADGFGSTGRNKKSTI
ncbi:LOW QUALITY PROTEIN: deoxyuridine 5'-triphosphate nucleotidohydrolase, mitochondrial-like [Homarus americanus]|uniref:LOW QUALITY PROTEIN: deoxyuridine 5'-triphosphate nucleotidohydrolase, mitochondrial-like n=1 Tax=Homarus americanus TaxID=6706 RepID=UPI001C440895|nr:LOW QUALITY PROTEIN: deoxyuridine 5'-triphosphate nucleotidohydrolase, mitochondrial-like [Homarus americanus]